MLAEQRQEENDAFRAFIKNKDGNTIDKIVHRINNTITPQIDCTQCGACCKMLMINVTIEETKNIAGHLEITTAAFKEKYIEESEQGQLIMNSVPCHFLEDNKCTVYEQRFTECREFPHLHKKNFSGRLFGTLMHYAMCPIIFNVVEELKVEMGFITNS